jgi:hypothetical protein
MILNQLFGSYSKDIELRAADDKTEVLATDLGRQAGLTGLIMARSGLGSKPIFQAQSASLQAARFWWKVEQTPKRWRAR